MLSLRSDLGHRRSLSGARRHSGWTCCRLPEPVDHGDCSGLDGVQVERRYSASHPSSRDVYRNADTTSMQGREVPGRVRPFRQYSAVPGRGGRPFDESQLPAEPASRRRSLPRREQRGAEPVSGESVHRAVHPRPPCTSSWSRGGWRTCGWGTRSPLWSNPRSTSDRGADEPQSLPLHHPSFCPRFCSSSQALSGA